MAFYIRPEKFTLFYKEDGTQVLGIEDAKGYSTEAAAQAVIDSNPSWITALTNSGKKMIVDELTYDGSRPST